MVGKAVTTAVTESIGGFKRDLEGASKDFSPVDFQIRAYPLPIWLTNQNTAIWPDWVDLHPCLCMYNDLCDGAGHRNIKNALHALMHCIEIHLYNWCRPTWNTMVHYRAHDKNRSFEEMYYPPWQYMEEEGSVVIKLEGVVMGYHYLKVKANIGELLDVEREEGNEYDPHALRVKRGSTVLGRAPWLFSKSFCYLLEQGKTIQWFVFSFANLIISTILNFHFTFQPNHSCTHELLNSEALFMHKMYVVLCNVNIFKFSYFEPNFIEKFLWKSDFFSKFWSRN